MLLDAAFLLTACHMLRLNGVRNCWGHTNRRPLKTKQMVGASKDRPDRPDRPDRQDRERKTDTQTGPGLLDEGPATG